MSEAPEERPAPAAAENAEERLPARLGRYELTRRLGAGASGVVYAALHRERGEPVALKTLHKLDPSALFRLKNEFRRVADITHPNVAALYELASERGRWYMTMELVDGLDFVAYVRADPARAAERARHALAQLADGLLALHRAGTLHRDIKASNVLITRDDRLVILDFGLAGGEGAEAETTGEDLIVGTPAYMAPEQAAGGPATAASEWYAVGVMLFEALTGELPFTGSPLRVLAAKQQRDAPPLALAAPGVSPDLAEIGDALLRRDPAARLSGAALLARLRSAPPPPSPDSSAIFIGRAELLAALDDAFDAARGGAPITVYVHGPSGIGKSALVDRFLAGASRGGALVLCGRCYERESVPYKAFDSLIDALSDHLRQLPPAEAAALMPREIHALARVFPVLERIPVIAAVPRRAFEIPDPQELRRRAFRGLRELLARIADRRPLVLVLVDMHWGDEDSARLLAELLAGADAPSLLVLGVYRSDEASTSPMLAELRRLYDLPEMRHEVRNLVVGPLRADEARALALALLQSAPGGAAEREAAAEVIARESEGSPLFVEELSRQVRDGDRGLAAAAELSLSGFLRARTRQLSPSARRLLEILALAGRPLRRGLALRAAELAHAAGPALAQLHAANLARSRGPGDDDAIECFHDRVREAAVAEIPAEDRARRHLALAAAMVDEGSDDLEVIAQHYAAAGERERAARYAALAAERAAAALAFNRAAALYRLARAWTLQTGPEAQALLLRHADALVYAGRAAAAAPLYLQAAESAPSAEAIELRRRAAEHLLVSGRIDEGQRLLRPLLASVGLSYPTTPARATLALVARLTQLRLRGTSFTPRDLASVAPRDLLPIDVCWTASRGLYFVDPARSAAFALRALLLALGLGEPARVARGLASVGLLLVSRDDEPSAARGAALLREAEAVARRVDDPYLIGLTHTVDGIADVSGGRWAAGIQRIDRGMQILHDRCAGIAWEVCSAQLATMIALLALGRLRELSVRAQAWRREAEDAGDQHGEVWSALFGAIPALAAGAPREARDEVRAAVAHGSRVDFHFPHLFALHVEVLADLYEGRPLAAWGRVERAWPSVEASHLLGWSRLRILAAQTRGAAAIAAANANPGEASRLLAAAAAVASDLDRRCGRRSDARAVAHLLRAGVAATHGDRRRVITGLEAAETAFQAAEMAIEAACARRRLAECAGDDAAIAAADAQLRRLAVADPRRWSRVIVPGFADEDG